MAWVRRVWNPHFTLYLWGECCCYLVVINLLFEIKSSYYCWTRAQCGGMFLGTSVSVSGNSKLSCIQGIVIGGIRMKKRFSHQAGCMPGILGWSCDWVSSTVDKECVWIVSDTGTSLGCKTGIVWSTDGDCVFRDVWNVSCSIFENDTVWLNFKITL